VCQLLVAGVIVVTGLVNYSNFFSVTALQRYVVTSTAIISTTNGLSGPRG